MYALRAVTAMIAIAVAVLLPTTARAEDIYEDCRRNIQAKLDEFVCEAAVTGSLKESRVRLLTNALSSSPDRFGVSLSIGKRYMLPAGERVPYYYKEADDGQIREILKVEGSIRLNVGDYICVRALPIGKSALALLANGGYANTPGDIDSVLIAGRMISWEAYI